MLSLSITAAQPLTLTKYTKWKMIQAWNEVVAEDRKKELDLSAFKELGLTEHGVVYYMCESKSVGGGLEEKSWLEWLVDRVLRATNSMGMFLFFI